MTLRVVLTVAGALCEIVGLTWLVAEAARARSDEFGERGIFRRIWFWLVYWFSPPSKPAKLTVGASLESAASVNAVVIKGAETETERLRRELDELRDRVARHEDRVVERFAAIEARIEQTAATLGQRLGDLEAYQRERRRAGLRREIRGARLFILGAILSAAGNLV